MGMGLEQMKKLRVQMTWKSLFCRILWPEFDIVAFVTTTATKLRPMWEIILSPSITTTTSFTTVKSAVSHSQLKWHYLNTNLDASFNNSLYTFSTKYSTYLICEGYFDSLEKLKTNLCIFRIWRNSGYYIWRFAAICGEDRHWVSMLLWFV